MIIAIASLGKKETDKVSPIAGRAPFYLFFKNKKLVKVQKNPFVYGSGGAGFAVAKMLADEGAEIVITGQLGPNMITALKEKNIKAMMARDMTVKQALEKALAGKLERLE